MASIRWSGLTIVLALGIAGCAVDDATELGTAEQQVALPAPTNLQVAVISATGVRLSWDPSPGAAKYIVQRGPSPGTETTLTSVPAGTVTWSYNHLAPDTTDCWVVRNLSATRELSEPSNEVCSSTSTAPVPAVPAGLGATATGLTRIQITWLPSAGAQTYQVYAAPTPSTPVYVSTVTHPTTAFTLANVAPNLPYGFQVEALNAAGRSGRSAVVVGSTAGIGAPTNVAAEPVATSRIIVTWDAVPNARSYDVFAAPTPATPTYLATVTAPETTFRHNGLAASTSYGYQVRAALREGDSALSTPIATATTLGDPPPGVPPPTGFCRNGWCWVYPRPEGVRYQSVWGATANDVWAIGSNGSYGSLARYRDGVWTDHSDPSRTWSFGAQLWGTSASDVWASAGRAGVLRWNGSSWSSTGAGVGSASTLGGTGASDVWVFDSDARNARQWNGATWTVRALPSGWSPIAFGGNTPGAVVVVSDRGGIARWNGTGWTVLDSGSRSAFRAVVIDSTHVIATVLGGIDFWDGSTWVRRTPPTAGTWSEIAATSFANVFVTRGATPVAGPTHYHWNGSTWTPLPDPTEPRALEARWVDPSGGLWAIGSGGEVKVWNGTAWTARTSGRNTASAVWGTSDSDIWLVLRENAVADAHHTVHWNGASWTEVDFPFDITYPGTGGYSVGAIWGSAPDDYWIAAGLLDPTIPRTERYLIHWDGTAWTRVGPLGTDQPGGVGFASVWGTAADNVYAVGAGALYHFDGVAWSLDTRMPGGSRVFGSGPNDVYVINRDVLWRWNGTQWTSRTAPQTLRSGWANAASDVWLFGTGNLHFDGSAFRVIDSNIGTILGGPLGTAAEMFTFSTGQMTRWLGGVDGTAVRSPAFFQAHSAWRSPSGRLYAAGTGLLVHAP